MSPRGRIGVPRLPPGVPMIREEGVPKLRGELRSISDVGTWVGGEEKRGAPGELASRCRLGGGDMTSSGTVGEVTSEVCKTPAAASEVEAVKTGAQIMAAQVLLTRSAPPSFPRSFVHRVPPKTRNPLALCARARSQITREIPAKNVL